MKKTILLLGGAAFLLAGPVFSARAAEEPVPVWREAVDVQGSIVGVDVYYVGENMLETKVIGFMQRTRPKLKSILVVGPGVGRLGPTTRKTLLAGLEKDPPFPTRHSGVIDMSEGSETVAGGTLSRERIQHLLPVEEMREEIEKLRKKGKDAHYEYWVYMESQQRGGEVLRFKFDLDKLPDIVLAHFE